MPPECLSAMISEMEGWHEELGEAVKRAKEMLNSGPVAERLEGNAWTCIAFQQATLKAFKDFDRNFKYFDKLAKEKK